AQGWIDGGTPASLIGDTPADVLAAKANGLRSIAVATGISSFEELAAISPDLLVADLRGLRLDELL
ncbi:MAG: HAD hydrolase-like protein, partial [Acidobacteriota bacterium]